MRAAVAIAVLTLAASALTGCGGGADGGITTPPPAGEPVAAVVVDPAEALVAVDEQVELTAETRAADGTVLTGRTVTWASSDEAAATVNPTSGARTVVTGLAQGTVTITATSEGRQGTAEVSVERLVGFELVVTPQVDTVVVGQRVQFQAEVRELDGTVLPETFTWSAKDQDPAAVVAEVDPATGVVTGLAPGEAVIVATPAAHAGTGSAGVLVLAFNQVSAGLDHTCGVTTAGAAYCWGNNDAGQLGDGTTTDRTRPVPVANGLLFTSVSAGDHHTCGVTTVGAGFFAAYCWGDNTLGKLGDGTTTDRSRPAQAGIFSFAAVSAGSSHTCGLTTRSAHCWGANGSGQLGAGTTDIFTSVPVAVAPPVGLLLTALSAGSSHNCGITSGGQAYCWGANVAGQLGDGTTLARPAPVAVAPPAGQSAPLAFTTLSPGTSHSCGRTADGVVYCWGANGSGQLGDGTTTNRRTPAPVLALVAFTGLEAGLVHSCALGSTGAAYCWGDNLFGQLGDGTTTSRSLPTALRGGLTFSQVTAGSGHSCGVTPDGRPYCWGMNVAGQLGTGTMELSRVPAAVVSP